MIKRLSRTVTIVACTATLLTSCYSYTSVVGRGPQGNTATKEWNHYVIGGLIPVSVSDSKRMAGGASDYSVYTRHSFINLILTAITGGIYTPTTTTVTK